MTPRTPTALALTTTIAAALSLFALGGCTSAPTSDRPPWAADARPLVAADGHARSVALSTPDLHAAEAQMGYPWYATRNDERAAVDAGYRSATFMSAATYTVDRQTTVSGRPRIHFHERTTQLEVVRGVR